MKNFPIMNCGRYEFAIKSLLGSGGFSTVYQAIDTNTGKEIALKIGHSPGTLPQCNNESRALQAIQSPHIPLLYSRGFWKGSPWIAMERVPGKTLEELSAHGPFGWRWGVNILTQVGYALKAGADVGLLHGDVKPSNIIVRPDGQVTLIDWGLSEYDPYVSVDPALFCTPEYTSPEKIIGDSIDIRSDLYSLGIVLFELILGRTPFEGSSYLDVFEKVCTKQPDYTALPPLIQPIIQKSVHRNPNDRFNSADEILGAFTSLLNRAPSSYDPQGGQNVFSRTVPNPSTKSDSFEKLGFSSEWEGAVGKNLSFGIAGETEGEFVSTGKRSPRGSLVEANK